MTYESGDLKLATNAKKYFAAYDNDEDWVWDVEHPPPRYDARDDDYPGEVSDLVIWLPHSCDEWIIGGVAEAKQLIADLQAAVEEAEG